MVLATIWIKTWEHLLFFFFSLLQKKLKWVLTCKQAKGQEIGKKKRLYRHKKHGKRTNLGNKESTNCMSQLAKGQESHQESIGALQPRVMEKKKDSSPPFRYFRNPKTGHRNSERHNRTEKKSPKFSDAKNRIETSNPKNSRTVLKP